MFRYPGSILCVSGIKDESTTGGQVDNSNRFSYEYETNWFPSVTSETAPLSLIHTVGTWSGHHRWNTMRVQLVRSICGRKSYVPT